MLIVVFILLVSGVGCQFIHSHSHSDNLPVGQHGVHDVLALQMANFVAMNYSFTEGVRFTLGYNFKLLRVEKDESQNGTAYRLLLDLDMHRANFLCEVTVLDQPEIPKRTITEDHCRQYFKPIKRQLVISRGLFDVELSTDVKDAAAFVVSEINARPNNINPQCLVSIEGQKAQFQDGLVYEMDITLTHSVPLGYNTSITEYECVPQEHSMTKNCHIRVLDQPWKDSRYTLQRYHCVEHSLRKDL